jgi:hypothetical protein
LNHFGINVDLFILLYQCGSNLHALPYLLYEMNLVDAIDMRPFGLCSNLVKVDSCQFSYSVLNYFSPFDPRLCPRGLLMFELCFSGQRAYGIEGIDSHLA